MNTRSWSTATASAVALGEVLRPLGFTTAADGYELAAERIRLVPGRHWWTLRQELTDADEASRELLEPPGQPGLWKRVRVGNKIERMFALPASLLDGQGLEEHLEEDHLAWQAMSWALETAQGRVPSGWLTPDRAVLESWFTREQLTVVSGALLRQGELIAEPDRLALRFPIVPELSAELPAARRAWLRLLLEEAQNQWHLVRCGWLEGPDGTAAVVEVDLTGAPGALHEDLFVTSLEAVRWTVQWLGEPADWLADAAVASELLAVCPNQEPTKGAP